jgi:uncharacterized protein YfdQ (DUF2303 family)
MTDSKLIEGTALSTLRGTDAAAAIREIRELTTAAVNHEPWEILAGIDAVVVPDAHRLVITDIRADERSDDAPDRRRGTVVLQELEPFIRYVNLHHDEHATTVWTEHEPTALGAGSQAVGSIVAVLDDHAPSGAAGWGEHVARLDLLTTPEWRHWLRRDGELGKHLDFAEHLEDGIPEIRQPAAADLLDLVQQISVTRNMSFSSKASAHAGAVTLSYSEEEDAKSSKRGELDIPQSITLSLAPFPGGKRVELKANVRYRINEGGLTIGYKLERPQDALRQAVEHLHADLLDGLEDVIHDRVFRGKPVPASSRPGPRRELAFHTPPTGPSYR